MKGTGSLLRLALRLDRWTIAVWVIAVAGLVAGTASSFDGLYPTAQSRAQFAATISANPTFTALYGPGAALDTIGGLTVWRISTTSAVLLALMSSFMVVRHTRAEEEAGRLEVVGSAVVGRHAPLTAALMLAAGTNLLIAACVTLGLVAVGLPVAGSAAFALTLAGVGLTFAAVAAVTAQLTESSRAANGLAAAVLGLAFLVRAGGDASEVSWISALSPLGWQHRVKPYAEDTWWVFGVYAAVVAALVAAAYLLVSRRDHGLGLLPQRLGPPAAAPSLRSPLALAWRLHRGLLIGWLVGFLICGAVLGGLADSAGQLVEDNQALADYFAQTGSLDRLAETFIATLMGIVGVIGSAYTVQAALRLRAEETALRAEPVLATRVARLRWVAGHLVFALAGTALIILGAGLTLGLVYGRLDGDIGHGLSTALQAAAVQLPAAWVMAGVAVALFGLAPRWSSAAWAAVVVSLLIVQFGPLLQLDQWILDVSPFTHVPHVPAVAFSITPVLWLLAVTAALLGAGLAGFRRRDIG